jgi:hypothetical protein
MAEGSLSSLEMLKGQLGSFAVMRRSGENCLLSGGKQSSDGPDDLQIGGFLQTTVEKQESARNYLIDRGCGS